MCLSFFCVKEIVWDAQLLTPNSTLIKPPFSLQQKTQGLIVSSLPFCILQRDQRQAG